MYILKIFSLLFESGLISFILPSVFFLFFSFIFITRTNLVNSRILAFLLSFLFFLLILLFPVVVGINVNIFVSILFFQLFFISIFSLVNYIIFSTINPKFFKILQDFWRKKLGLVSVFIIGVTIFITSVLSSFVLSSNNISQTILLDDEVIITTEFSPSIEFMYTITLLILLILLIIMLILGSKFLEKKKE